jgi:hypothetical protein
LTCKALLDLPERLARSPARAVTITRRGRPVLAILPWEFYESIVEAIPDHRIGRLIARRADQLARSPEHQGQALIGDLAGFRSVRAVGQRLPCRATSDHRPRRRRRPPASGRPDRHLRARQEAAASGLIR